MDILLVKGASSDAAREVILDTRAGGFRTGSSTVGAYLTYLQKEGVNLKMVVVGSCQKGISAPAMGRSCSAISASYCQFSFKAVVVNYWPL